MTNTRALKPQLSVNNHTGGNQRKRRSENYNKRRAACKDKFNYVPNPVANNVKSMISANHQNLNQNYFNKPANFQHGNQMLSGIIKTIEDVYLQNVRITDPKLVDQLFGDYALREEIMGIKPVQFAKKNGTIHKSFKVIAIVGDYNGHIGIGYKTSTDIADAVKEAKKIAKLSIFPVVRGSWQANDLSLHTINAPVLGKYGSIEMKIMPAPKGTGIVACSVTKKILEMAGYKDIFISTTGHAKSTFNYIIATFKALQSAFQVQMMRVKRSEDERNIVGTISISSNKLSSSPHDNYGEFKTGLQSIREIIQ